MLNDLQSFPINKLDILTGFVQHILTMPWATRLGMIYNLSPLSNGLVHIVVCEVLHIRNSKLYCHGTHMDCTLRKGLYGRTASSVWRGIEVISHSLSNLTNGSECYLVQGAHHMEHTSDICTSTDRISILTGIRSYRKYSVFSRDRHIQRQQSITIPSEYLLHVEIWRIRTCWGSIISMNYALNPIKNRIWHKVGDSANDFSIVR